MGSVSQFVKEERFTEATPSAVRVREQLKCEPGSWNLRSPLEHDHRNARTTDDSGGRQQDASRQRASGSGQAGKDRCGDFGCGRDSPSAGITHPQRKVYSDRLPRKVQMITIQPSPTAGVHSIPDAGWQRNATGSQAQRFGRMPRSRIESIQAIQTAREEFDDELRESWFCPTCGSNQWRQRAL